MQPGNQRKILKSTNFRLFQTEVYASNAGVLTEGCRRRRCLVLFVGWFGWVVGLVLRVCLHVCNSWRLFDKSPSPRLNLMKMAECFEVLQMGRKHCGKGEIHLSVDFNEQFFCCVFYVPTVVFKACGFQTARAIVILSLETPLTLVVAKVWLGPRLVCRKVWLRANSMLNKSGKLSQNVPVLPQVVTIVRYVEPFLFRFQNIADSWFSNVKTHGITCSMSASGFWVVFFV